MRVFLAGASGAIGRPLVRALVAGGHEVTGMTRREPAAAEIRAAGAAAAVCDVFDRPALERAVAAAEPEVVIHELTALPARLDLRERGVYDANNRIRTEGTRNLIAAAGAAGARRIVAQSIAFVYAPIGGPVKVEDDPVMNGAEGEFGAALDAAFELERQVLAADGLVMRYGFFYGPGTSYASDGAQAEDVRRRRFPIVGTGDGNVLVRPRRRRGDGDDPRLRAGSARDLQRLRLRAGGAARVVAGLRGGARREAAAAGAEADRAAARGRERGGTDDHASRRLEREGDERARLGAPVPELAPGLCAGARISSR